MEVEGAIAVHTFLSDTCRGVGPVVGRYVGRPEGSNGYSCIVCKLYGCFFISNNLVKSMTYSYKVS